MVVPGSAAAGRLSSARSVAAFVGVGDEPDTLPLVEALARRGVRVLLPVVLPDLDLDWAWFDQMDGLALTRHGLREPTGPCAGRHAVGAVDVVVVPAFAIDGDGRRLGQGGGCYDRALQRVSPGTPVLAVVFDDEVMTSSLPDEPHDRKVTGRLPR
jgi:5-formyltetrahydrofolate cyclo-ligase